jgi:hypothetical protein
LVIKDIFAQFDLTWNRFKSIRPHSI